MAAVVVVVEDVAASVVIVEAVVEVVVDLEPLVVVVVDSVAAVVDSVAIVAAVEDSVHLVVVVVDLEHLAVDLVVEAVAIMSPFKQIVHTVAPLSKFAFQQTKFIVVGDQVFFLLDKVRICISSIFVFASL